MQLYLQPVGGYWFVGVVAALLFALLAGVGPRHIELPFGRKLKLKLLRLGAILLLLFALLRPTFQLTRTEPEQASLLLLADRSRSMQVEDSLDNRSRWEAVELVLSEAEDELKSLGDNWTVSRYAFSETLEPLVASTNDPEVGSPQQGGQSTKPTGDQSALGFALQELLEREGGQRLRGVVILSDGAQRAAPPLDVAPQIVARQYAAESIPLYTFAFGQPGGSDRADLAIEELLVSGTVFAGAPLRVSGQLRAEGYANRTAQVQLLWEGESTSATDEALVVGEMQVVDSLKQSIVGADSRTPVSLGHVSVEPGEYKLTLQVTPPEGELVTTNNQASTFVTVREGGIKVLYLIGATKIGGGPGREQKFVRSALAESPDIVLTRRVFDYRRPRQNLTAELQPGSYDVVILSDVDKDALNGDSWRALADMVSRGTGLMMGGGYHSFGPGGFRESPLADVLPVNIGPAERQNFREKLRDDVHIAGPIRMVPSGAVGTAHPIMQLSSQSNLSEWAELPAQDGANRLSRNRLKPNAQVLAETDDEQRHPLLVAGQAGAGRTLAFAGDSTWRWKLQGRGEEFRNFWRQVVLWLAKKDGRPQGQVWIDLANRRVSRGGRIDIEVGGTPEGEAANTAAIDFEVVITNPAGERIPLVTVASDENQRVGAFAATDQAGDYLATVVGSVDGVELSRATARFLVPEQDLELDRPGAEPALLAQLAKISEAAGGEAFAPEELPSLIARLAKEEPNLRTEVLQRITYWDKWPFLLLFAGVIGVEWFLRKRWGLV